MPLFDNVEGVDAAHTRVWNVAPLSFAIRVVLLFPDETRDACVIELNVVSTKTDGFGNSAYIEKGNTANAASFFPATVPLFIRCRIKATTSSITIALFVLSAWLALFLSPRQNCRQRPSNSPSKTPWCITTHVPSSNSCLVDLYN